MNIKYKNGNIINKAKFFSNLSFDYNHIEVSLIDQSSEELMIELVSYIGSLLQYIDNQTPKIIWAAIKKNRDSFKFIKNQTPELAIEFIEYLENEIPYPCSAITESMRSADIDRIIKTCFDFKISADHPLFFKLLEKNLYFLKFLNPQPEELCFKFVRDYGNALAHIVDQTPELCLMAIQRDKNAWIHVKIVNASSCDDCIKKLKNKIKLKDIIS